MSDAVLIKVQGTGSGIAPNDLPYVFERFCRADKSRREHKGRSGLNLPIAKALVEAHRGRIWAESDGVPGRGNAVFDHVGRRGGVKAERSTTRARTV